MRDRLWTEVCNIVQEAVTKTIPKEKNARQNNALQITEKRREAKGKGEYYQSDFDHLVMFMCKIISCVVERECLLWPVCSFGKALLTFSLLHFNGIKFLMSIIKWIDSHKGILSREETEKFSSDITWSQQIISVKSINTVYRKMKIHSRIENQKIVLGICV